MRATGNAKLKEIVYQADEEDANKHKLFCPSELMSIAEAVRWQHYVLEPRSRFLFLSDPETAGYDVQLNTPAVVARYTKALDEEFIKGSPNLTLNIGGAMAPISVRIMCAIGRLVLQAVVIATWALTTYHWKFTRAGKLPPDYGFPCAACGAIVISIGLFLCGQVVEDITAERTYVPRPKTTESEDKPQFKVIRIQKYCVVGAQIFGSMMIRNDDADSSVKMSRRLRNAEVHECKYQLRTLVGIIPTRSYGMELLEHM